MLGGGDEVAKQCRKPEIMSDAAKYKLCLSYYSYLHCGDGYVGRWGWSCQVVS